VLASFALVAECGAVGSARVWGTRGRRFKSCHSDVKFRLVKPPPLRRLWITVGVVWIVDVVGVVLAVEVGSWLVAAYAMGCAVAAAGWLLATMQWLFWHEFSRDTLTTAAFIVHGRDEIEAGARMEYGVRHDARGVEVVETFQSRSDAEDYALRISASRDRIVCRLTTSSPWRLMYPGDGDAQWDDGTTRPT
jgi:hypothetical protein